MTHSDSVLKEHEVVAFSIITLHGMKFAILTTGKHQVLFRKEVQNQLHSLHRSPLKL